MTALSSPSTRRQSAPVSRGRSAALIAAAVVGAVVVNELIAVVFRAIVKPDVMQLQPPGVAVLTVVGVLLGALGWAIVRNLARRPATVLRWLVPAVVVLSLIPDVALLLPSDPALAVVGLMLMHIAAVLVAVPLYRRAMPVS